MVLLWEEKAMLRTITIGSCISVQGMFIKRLENAKVVVRVGDKTFTGRPVDTGKRAA